MSGLGSPNISFFIFSVDGIESSLHLLPLVRAEQDRPLGNPLQFPDSLRALQDEILQEGYRALALPQQGVLCLHVLA